MTIVAARRPRGRLSRRQRMLGMALMALSIGAVGCRRMMQGPQPLRLAAPQDVYRGLDSSNTGKAVLSPSQFRFNPDLSTFDAAPGNKPCALRLTIDTNDTVQGLPGYTGASTPPPAGHWSVYKPGGTTDSAARAAVSAYARANTGRIVPASCRP